MLQGSVASGVGGGDAEYKGDGWTPATGETPAVPAAEPQLPMTIAVRAMASRRIKRETRRTGVTTRYPGDPELPAHFRRTAASLNDARQPNATIDSTTGVRPMPKRPITRLIPPGTTAPPSIEAGKSHEVARASPGLSFASQTMPVGKIGAIARPARMYATGAAAGMRAASRAAAATADPMITITRSGMAAGISAARSLPAATASQKPDVNVAAASDCWPTDSRCEVIQPPVPASSPT